MNRDTTQDRGRISLGPSLGRLVSRSAMLVALAVGAGLVLVQALVQPPAADMRLLALYMLASAVATIGAGALLVGALDRRGPSTLRAKVALGTVIGGIIGILNVLVVARLMFVSTSHDLRLLMALLGMSAVAAFGFSLWIADDVTGRLAAATEAIRRLAAGDLDAPTVARADAGGDEVASLTRDVAILGQRLRDAEDQRRALDRDRRDFTVAISHDLRTPLASIGAMSEALADGVVDDPTEVARYYQTIRREVDRLTHMVDDLFQLSQLDAGAFPLDRRMLDLAEVAAEVVDAMQPYAAARGIALTLVADASVPSVAVDGALMERAIRNLVTNAVQYSPAERAVEVRVAADEDHVNVAVRDHGRGIDPLDLPRVWDRFFRGDRARSRGTRDGGAGLGLAIVRGIIEAHGGHATVTSTPGAGTEFVLQLPR